MMLDYTHTRKIKEKIDYSISMCRKIKARNDNDILVINDPDRRDLITYYARKDQYQIMYDTYSSICHCLCDYFIDVGFLPYADYINDDMLVAENTGCFELINFMDLCIEAKLDWLGRQLQVCYDPATTFTISRYQHLRIDDIVYNRDTLHYDFDHGFLWEAMSHFHYHAEILNKFSRDRFFRQLKRKYGCDMRRSSHKNDNRYNRKNDGIGSCVIENLNGKKKLLSKKIKNRHRSHFKMNRSLNTIEALENYMKDSSGKYHDCDIQKAITLAMCSIILSGSFDVRHFKAVLILFIEKCYDSAYNKQSFYIDKEVCTLHKKIIIAELKNNNNNLTANQLILNSIDSLASCRLSKIYATSFFRTSQTKSFVTQTIKVINEEESITTNYR